MTTTNNIANKSRIELIVLGRNENVATALYNAAEPTKQVVKNYNVKENFGEGPSIGDIAMSLVTQQIETLTEKGCTATLSITTLGTVAIKGFQYAQQKKEFGVVDPSALYSEQMIEERQNLVDDFVAALENAPFPVVFTNLSEVSRMRLNVPEGLKLKYKEHLTFDQGVCQEYEGITIPTWKNYTGDQDVQTIGGEYYFTRPNSTMAHKIKVRTITKLYDMCPAAPEANLEEVDEISVA